MRKPAAPRERRFPLHVHISALFTLLLLLTGVVLGLFNYQQTSQIIFSSSSKLFERIQQNVQQGLDNTYRPIRHVLSLLALDPATRSDHLDGRLALLPPPSFRRCATTPSSARCFSATRTATSSWSDRCAAMP